jgi:hypothetical protein
MKDIHIDLFRKGRAKNSTQGEMLLDGVFECYTLEDKDRMLTSNIRSEEIKKSKVYGETCIPAGVYEVVMVFSKKRGYSVPQLLGVKAFVAIQIHVGNFIKDTLGCILVGQRCIQNAKTKEWELQSSTRAFDALMEKLSACVAAGGRIFIHIHN